MEASRKDKTDRAAELMMNDLRQIEGDIRWLYNDSFWPKGKTNPFVGVKGGAAGFDPVDPNGPDHVKAKRFDIGLGNDRSREAYLRTVQLLSVAEIRSAYALKLVGTCPQPVLSYAYRKPEKLNVVIHQIHSLAKTLHLLRMELVGFSDLRSSHLYEASRQMTGKVYSLQRDGYPQPNAYEAIVLAKSTVRKAMAQGKITELPKVVKCRVCLIRPYERNGANGRCSTCTKYYYKHGTERPRELDNGSDPIAEAKAAQDRRNAAGYGYGAS